MREAQPGRQAAGQPERVAVGLEVPERDVLRRRAALARQEAVEPPDRARRARVLVERDEPVAAEVLAQLLARLAGRVLPGAAAACAGPASADTAAAATSMRAIDGIRAQCSGDRFI